jgi:predicted dehydrogenase
MGFIPIWRLLLGPPFSCGAFLTKYRLSLQLSRKGRGSDFCKRMKVMNVALLGYGFMGGAHLAAFQGIDGVVVKSVSTRVRPTTDGPARGNMDLKSGPLPDTVEWNPDWRSVLADPEIDIVDICLPTDMHLEVVLAAFAAGKHVLSEKPMALTSAQCDQILAAAKASDHVYMVAQVLRFMYPYRYAADFVTRHSREKIKHCTLRRSTGYPQWGGWLTQEEKSGGAILDLLSHDIDLALSIFGAPRSLSAMSIGEVDTMRGVLQYDSGLEVVVEGGWLAPKTPFAAGFEIDTDEEKLIFAGDKLSLIRGQHTESIEIPQHDPYFDEIACFVECCRKNSSPALCLPVESAQAVELSLKLKASRDAGGMEMMWQQ